MPKSQNTNDKFAGVLMILSPAKTLDLTEYEGDASLTEPECSETKTREVAEAIKKRKEGELAKLLGISANLAKTAHEYWSCFEVDANKRKDKEKKPSIYAFSGAAYQGLEISTCSESAIRYMQNNLRIIDPTYGVLRPLDVIQPYRLEMATRNLFPNDKKIKLADWWKPAVTQSLSRDLEGRLSSNRLLVNLASDEYAAAVDPSDLTEETICIKVVFKEEGRVIAVHAKRARGLMVRYLAEKAVTDMKGIQQFAEEGYKFIPGQSDESTLVFDRKKQQATKKKKKTANAKTPEKSSKRTRSK